MKSLDTRIAIGVGIISLWVVASSGLAGRPGEVPIGMFTAVQGQVTVAHSGAAQPVSVKLRDHVLFRDIIETQQKSHTKALLNDDSLLTVGEFSQVEINEHIYDPANHNRSVVINLLRGKVRALVNKVFTGSESRFEVHTPTAVAAARGTYFVVWFGQGASGIANIGTQGRVDFTSGGQTVAVNPGHFSLAFNGAAPLLPSVLTGDGVPAQVTRAVSATEVKDAPGSEAAHQAVQALSGDVPIGGPTGVPGTPQGTQATGVGIGQSPPGFDNANVKVDINVTPPAVTSGSAANARGVGRGLGGTPPGLGGTPPGLGGDIPAPVDIPPKGGPGGHGHKHK